MTQHRTLLQLFLLLSVSSGSLFAQGTTTSGLQTASPSTAATNDSRPMATTEQVVAQSIIEAQKGNTAPPLIFLQPSPGPTIQDRINAYFWNSVADPASQFLTDLMTGFKNDPGGTIVVAGSTLLSIGQAIAFEPSDVSLESETVGDWIKGNPGASPSLLSGVLSDMNPWSTLSDICGSVSIDCSTAARDGSNAAPLIYSALSAAKNLDDIAVQGASSSQPQALSVDTIPGTVLNPIQSSDDQVLQRIQQARQQKADLDMQQQKLNQESVNLSNQISAAESKGAVLQQIDGEEYKRSIDQAHLAIAGATNTFAPDSGANAFLSGTDDGWGLLESQLRQLSLLSASRQKFDPCRSISTHTIVYNVGCTNTNPPPNVCGPGYAVNPGALAAAQAPWNPAGSQLPPWRDPKYGPLDSSGRVAWCVPAKR